MNRIVLLKAQSENPLSFTSPMAEVLKEMGRQVHFAESESELEHGDSLLIIGISDWVRIGKVFLERAGELGIERLLWSCEPLLPPDLPTSSALHHYLYSSSAKLIGHQPLLQGVLDRLAYLLFTRQSHGLPWNRTLNFRGRAFSYPAKESRRLLSCWRLGLIDTLYVSLEYRKKFLLNHRVPSKFVPIGYHPFWGRQLKTRERDIDVLFLGNTNRRRKALLEEIGPSLGKEGYRLKIVDTNCFGEARTELLNRTRILLNLNNLPWELPGMRMLMALSCKAMVISEQCTDTTPYESGKHFVMADPKTLGDKITYYLRNDDLRTEIADQGYRFITQEHTLKQSIRKINIP